jgi:hypothetical protein
MPSYLLSGLSWRINLNVAIERRLSVLSNLYKAGHVYALGGGKDFTFGELQS